MWQLIIEGGILALDLIYHRLTDGDAPRPPSEKQIGIPLIAAGTTYPLIYGKVRVKSPILAWTGKPYSIYAPADALVYANLTPEYFYAMSMHFVLGIPFTDDGISRLHKMYIGDQAMPYSPSWTARLSDLTGDGGFEPDTTRVVLNMLYIDTPTPTGTNFNPDNLVFGEVEFLNGKPTQKLIDDSGTPLTYLGKYMTQTTSANPKPEQNLSGTLNYLGTSDYRGYLSVFLFCLDDLVVRHWFVGPSAVVNAYSFECSSYVNSLDAAKWPATYILSSIGEDSNPANVLVDLIATYFGKLGLSRSLIDMDSFTAAAHTLAQEGHGYSRCFDQPMTAQDMVDEVLAQIDATLYEDPSTGKLGIKLIRNDYDPTTIPVIDKTNCKALQNIELGGWSGIPNRVRLAFTERANAYKDGEAVASNQANAGVGQDSQIVEIQLRMPGVTTQALANSIAERELAARSKPIMKCTAICDRSKLRVKHGDAVRVNWSGPDISGVVFRVAAIDRGTMSDQAIKLDLIADYFYVWRNQPPVHTGFGGHAADGELLPSA